LWLGRVFVLLVLLAVLSLIGLSQN
jgi:hypothetical protein